MFKKSSERQGEQEREVTTSPPASSQAPTPDRMGQNKVKEHRRSVLSPSIAVKGDISGTEDLVLEGKMEGTINLPKNEILIGPDGQVKADLTAMKVSIEGRVTGDIRGSERVVIKHSGKVEGNIVAPRVVLEDGCQFKGSVEMNTDASASGASAGARPQESKQQSGSSAGSSSKVNQYASDAKSRATSAS
ncbi:MAG TPA: polymer-forming cytoskeletal protein [Arenicellales bacterium]|nr:polymer-forming cytoskeletal protein [Arenicellales bacterium]